MPEWVMSFPSDLYFNIKGPIDHAINYMVKNWDPFFSAVSQFCGPCSTPGRCDQLIPWWLLLAAVFLATYRVSKKMLRSIMYAALLFFIGLMGLWSEMYQTLAIVVTSVIISLLIGFRSAF
jgi:glycine betaine/proline transport system permease protein